MNRCPLLTCACALLAVVPQAARAARGDPFGSLIAVAPARKAAGTLAFRLIAHQEAERAGLPYALVDAVMKIESDYNPGRIGDVGEIGLMQVRPATAAMLGFRGAPEALADPAVNIHYGTAYLGRAWHLAGGAVCRTLMKYRAGHSEEVMSPLSARYCARARAHLIAEGSPLAATIKPDDLVAAMAEMPVVGVGHGGGNHRPMRPFWARFEARVASINARLEAKWSRAKAY